MDLPPEVFNKIAKSLHLSNDRAGLFAIHPSTNALHNASSAESAIELKESEARLGRPIRKTQLYARIVEKIKTVCKVVESPDRLFLQLFRPREYRDMISREKTAKDSSLTGRELEIKSITDTTKLSVAIYDFDTLECYLTIFENWPMFSHLSIIEFHSTWLLDRPPEADYLTEDDEEEDEVGDGGGEEEDFARLSREEKVKMRTAFFQSGSFYEAEFPKTFAKAVFHPESNVFSVVFKPDENQIFSVWNQDFIADNNRQSLRILNALAEGSYNVPVDPKTNKLSTALRFIDFSEFRRQRDIAPPDIYENKYLRESYRVFSNVYTSPLFRLNMREFRAVVHTGCPVDEPASSSSGRQNQSFYEAVYHGFRSARELKTLVYDVDRLLFHNAREINSCRKFFNYMFQGILDNPDPQITMLTLKDFGAMVDIWPRTFYVDAITEMGLDDFRKGVMASSPFIWKLTCLPKLSKITLTLPYYSTSQAEEFGECLTRRRAAMMLQTRADPQNWERYTRAFELIDFRLSAWVRTGLAINMHDTVPHVFDQLENAFTSTLGKLSTFYTIDFCDNSSATLGADHAFIRPHGLQTLLVMLPLRTDSAIHFLENILTVLPKTLKKLAIYTLHNLESFASLGEFYWHAHHRFMTILNALFESQHNLRHFKYVGFPFSIDAAKFFQQFMASPVASEIAFASLTEPHEFAIASNSPFTTHLNRNNAFAIHAKFLSSFANATNLRSWDYSNAETMGNRYSKMMGMEFQHLRNFLLKTWNEKRWSRVFQWTSITAAEMAFARTPAIF